MRRMLLAAIGIIGLATTAEAQWNMAPTPQPAPQATNKYGWNRNWAWWKKDCGTGCNTGCGAGGHFATGSGHPQPQGGTLVFPMNPYIRSPRDFFMWEAGK